MFGSLQLIVVTSMTLYMAKPRLRVGEFAGTTAPPLCSTYRAVALGPAMGPGFRGAETVCGWSPDTVYK